MKLIKYEVTVISENEELDIEEALGESDIVNSEMFAFSMTKVLDMDFEFEERSEEGEQTGSWYDKWYTKASRLLATSKIGGESKVGLLKIKD